MRQPNGSTVTKSLAIIRSHPEGVTVDYIARNVNVSPKRAYEIINELVRDKLARKNRLGGRLDYVVVANHICKVVDYGSWRGCMQCWNEQRRETSKDTRQFIVGPSGRYVRPADKDVH